MFRRESVCSPRNSLLGSDSKTIKPTAPWNLSQNIQPSIVIVLLVFVLETKRKIEDDNEKNQTQFFMRCIVKSLPSFDEKAWWFDK